MSAPLSQDGQRQGYVVEASSALDRSKWYACRHEPADGSRVCAWRYAGLHDTKADAEKAAGIVSPFHASDCAVHNAPALPVGPCDCGIEP